MYYLQSRYYNPEWGRFVNADDVAFLGMNGTLLGYNLFAYCDNEPVNGTDVTGYLRFSLKPIKIKLRCERDYYKYNPRVKYTPLDAWKLAFCKTAAKSLKKILPNATKFYEYFLSCKGGIYKFDYTNTYYADKSVRNKIDGYIKDLRTWVHKNKPYSNKWFSVYSELSECIETSSTDYDWFAAIYRHTVSIYAQVYYNSNKKEYTIRYAITAYDRYNFDIYCPIYIGTPVEWSGRFVELGWGIFYDLRGTYANSITWKV